jgi:hypothetical protein
MANAAQRGVASSLIGVRALPCERRGEAALDPLGGFVEIACRRRQASIEEE